MHILQVLPSIMRMSDGELHVDVDYIESVRVYLENFDSLSVACPVTITVKDSGLERCRPVRDLPWGDRVKFIQLPSAYGLLDFIQGLSRVRKILRDQIKAADYLVFSPHSLIGDWPTLAVHEAIRQGKPYVIEADIVYESVAAVGFGRTIAPWKRYIKQKLIVPLFIWSYRYCLKHSALALFQGDDVYNAYFPFCVNPHNVSHHIPIYKR